MDPKKDVSTAILDQKKAPNKLLVTHPLTRLKRQLTIKTLPFSSVKPKCHNLKYLKETPSLLREKKEKKLWLLLLLITNSKRGKLE